MADKLNVYGMEFLGDLATTAIWDGGRSEAVLCPEIRAEVTAALPDLIKDPGVVELRTQLDTIRGAEAESVADMLSAAMARLQVCGICERRAD